MIPEGAENHIADSKADNESKLPLETQIPKGNRKIIKDLAQKYADEWNNRYPTKAFMKWDDYWSTACTAFDYFNSIKYSEQDLLDTWNAASDWQIEYNLAVEWGNTDNVDAPDKQQFFKTRFNIDL